jgi:hypothetical protein
MAATSGWKPRPMAAYAPASTCHAERYCFLSKCKNCGFLFVTLPNKEKNQIVLWL